MRDPTQSLGFKFPLLLQETQLPGNWIILIFVFEKVLITVFKYAATYTVLVWIQFIIKG